MPDGGTVNKAEATNEIIFISFDSNVYTDKFSFELRTRLFDTKRFTVTRKPRNERRIEQMGLENGLKIAKRTKVDEGIIFLWNKVLF